MCRTLFSNSWCGDNDYGEMFLNFKMHRDLQKYSGIDLSQVYLDDDSSAIDPSGVYGMWTRNAMDLTPSPYLSVQGSLRAKLVMSGDRYDESNPFHWDRLVVNCLGSDGYDLSLPCNERWKRSSGDTHVH
jgi:hypothetical protein